MLTAFEVHNYKSIKSLRLQMQPFMVLVGPNGAGKTNIVSALELIGDLLNRGNTDPARELGWDQIIRRGKKPARAGMSFRVEVQLPREIIQSALDFPIRHAPRRKFSLESVSVHAGLVLSGSVGDEDVSATKETLELVSPRSTLRIEASASGVTIDPGDDPGLWALASSGLFFTSQPDASDDPKAEAARELELIFGEKSLAGETERRILRILSIQRAYSVWLNYFLQACGVNRLRLDASSLRSDSVLRDSVDLGSSGDNLAAAVDRLRGHEKARSTAFTDVLHTLQQVYPRIEDVKPRRVGSGRMTLLVKEVGITGNLAQSSISDGVLHALALLVALQEESAGVLAIEEPENAIHPWSVSEIVRLAQVRGNRLQTLLTTHSPVVVDAVGRPEQLFIVEHGGSAGTTVRPAIEAEQAIAAIMRESGQKLGAIWIDGTLGGVPSSEV